MRTQLSYFFAIPLVFALLFAPALAQDSGGVQSGGADTATVKCGDEKNPCPKPAAPTDFKLNVKINNPLKVSTIQEAIKLFMGTVVKVAIPFIVVFFIWAGFNFILARGNPEGIKKAKNMFWYTIIGSLLIFGAWAITNAIIGTINAVGS